MVISFVVKSHTVKLEERIRDLVSGCGKATVQRYTGQLFRSADVHTFTFLDISKVDSVDASAGMRDNRGFHMANKGPLRGSEERMHLDI